MNWSTTNGFQRALDPFLANWGRIMPAQRRPVAFSNPFFALLLIASTLFALTSLAYLAGPNVVARARGDHTVRADSLRFTGWLDRHGPSMLGVEFAVMLSAGVLAMATDGWFSSKN
jgi:hypothetical protein